ncbi:hypothetical protein C0J52_22656 [Blattella germanica]|nr:hypothetical protein C0J52_22656 [Blattella germanica]
MLFVFRKCKNKRYKLIERRRITSSVSLSSLKEVTEQAFNEITKEDWKKVCDHVKKIADDYWHRGVVLEDEMERIVINISVESSDKSDIDIGSGTETASEDDDGHICAGMQPLQ